MARIMVVDDEPHITEVIERALRGKHAVVIARTGQEALSLLQQERERPDLIVLDIVLPHLNGIEVCRFIRSTPNLSSIPILFLSVKEKIEDKIAGFEAGGDDYLTKPFSLEELSLRIRALLRHTGYLTPTGRLNAGPISLEPESGAAWVSGQLVELTSVEFELLYYLASHAGEVVSTERLLQDVWGYPPGSGNSSLVRMHMLNLRRKIEADPAHPSYLATVPRHGYTLVLPGTSS